LKFEKYLSSARESAQKAGEYILKHLNKVKNIEFKGERNLVTEVDKKAEEIIKNHLKKDFPLISILGEELGGEGKSELLWVIDPLDGTNNFAHGFPIFCISIALLKNKTSLIGVVYDPLREELFWSVKEKGSFLNKKRIFVSKTKKLSNSLLATGFYYEFKSQFDTNIEHFINFLYHCQGVRRTGAAAIDLSWVASGRLDGFWELGLKPWDTAAGFLLVKEAGGKITKLNGKKFNPFHPEIVASNGLIHKQMINTLKS
jgi:myo-inositol-1(or 4)-monophosphatase